MSERTLHIDIDPNSGFCFGVTNAIKHAEEGLSHGPLYCLGDIVHNGEEVERLARLGLETIDYDDLRTLHGGNVLFRAHGEPPSTYEIARANGMVITDATCPVVLKLQERIRRAYMEHPEAQIVIYGQPGHAEVIGLCGQTNNNAIVVEGEGDLVKIDYERDIYLFSQTTKSVEGFQHLVDCIRERLEENANKTGRKVVFDYHDTICRNVSNRVANMREFARTHDVVLFVGGKKSSNAKVLYNHCKEANEHSYFVTGPDDPEFPEIPGIPGSPESSGSSRSSEIKSEDTASAEGTGCEDKTTRSNEMTLRIGITGATSTPQWLMEQVREKLREG